MPDPVILNTPKTPFGRYDISDGDAFGLPFVIESIENENNDSFWMPLRGVDGCHIGYAKFLCISNAQSLFQLDELRPAYCPIQELPDGCKHFLNLQQEEI